MPRADEKARKGEVGVRLAGRQAKYVAQAKNGQLDVSDWDLEELIRGYRRAKDGSFRGRPPQVVPREVHEELAKRVKNDVAHQLLEVVQEHVKPTLEKILEAKYMAPEDVPGLRLKAQVAQDLLDRFVVGKNETIEIKGNLKHEAVIADVTVNRTLELEEDEDEDIVDAEVVDEADAEDWEFDWDE